MIDREQIGIRIAALRKKVGLSQQALAEKLGVSAQAVSKWEGGKNLPDIDMFRELAWLFHMTIDSIVEGDLLFAQKSSQKGLPASVEALFPDAERPKAAAEPCDLLFRCGALQYCQRAVRGKPEAVRSGRYRENGRQGISGKKSFHPRQPAWGIHAAGNGTIFCKGSGRNNG